MKKKLIFVMISILLIGLLSGCQGKQDESNKDSEISITNEDITSKDSYSDIYENSDKDSQRSYGQFGFGINTNLEHIQEDENGRISFEYTGEEIRVPYYVENIDPDVNAVFGILAFTDGYAQPYRIEDAKGEVLYDTSYMQKFDLKASDKEEFYLVFKPVAGQEGDTIGFITATILQPDYIPETNNYGIYYSMSATIPQQIRMKQSVNAKITTDTMVEKEEISDEVIEKLKSSSAGEDVSEMLNKTFFCELNPVESSSDKSVSINNGVIHLKFLCYGGPEVLYRMNLYINNDPIDLNGCRIIEFQTETDKMVSGDIEIDASKLDLQEYNTIYAVYMTGKEDYTVSSIYATKPLLLKGEAK